jgi:hypothetical protein
MPMQARDTAVTANKVRRRVRRRFSEEASSRCSLRGAMAKTERAGSRS